MEQFNIWQILFGLVGAVGVVWGGMATWKRAKTESEISLANRYATEYQRQEDRILRLEERLDASVIRERARDDYISILRTHIATGKGEPPPPWPDILLHVHKE
jgi:hypothetical protein